MSSVPGPDGRPFRKGPIAVVVVGMAGTGKSTLVQRLNLHTEAEDIPSMYVNLDPACVDVNFGAAVDIRDTVDYAQVQKQYSLGPNGAIMTSLNLFATKVNDLIDVLESVADGSSASADAEDGDMSDDQAGDPSSKAAVAPPSSETRTDAAEVVAAAGAEDAAPLPRYLIFDTPGQIEVFTWSASGGVVLSALSAAFPTVVVYVLDAARCAAGPEAFGANILYAASIAARTGLPFVLAVNKADAADADLVMTWLKDPLAFTRHINSIPSHKSTYAHSFAQSLSLFVGEFVEVVPTVAVSAVTGSGVSELFEAIDKARDTFLDEVVPRMVADAEAKKIEGREKARRDLVALEDELVKEKQGRGGGASAGGAAGAEDEGTGKGDDKGGDITSVPTGGRGRGSGRGGRGRGGMIVSREPGPAARGGMSNELLELSKAAQRDRYADSDDEGDDYEEEVGTRRRKGGLGEDAPVRRQDGLNLLRFGGLAPAARQPETYSGSEGEPSTGSDDDEVEGAAAEVRFARWCVRGLRCGRRSYGST